MLKETIILKKGAASLEAYLDSGGFQGLKRALGMSREEVVAEIQKSGLRGRGGAGFPTAKKWEMVLRGRGKDRYVVCNASEGEPGTFKDRYLMVNNPYRLLEGILIAAYVIGARKSYVFFKDKHVEANAAVERAIEELYGKGYLGSAIFGSNFQADVEPVTGPADYVAGEETAMLEVIEGRRAQPRQKPPFYPSSMGLYRQPTLVNNVETLSAVTHILANGAEWYRGFGVPTTPGTALVSLSGAVERPGVYEVVMGSSLRSIIDDLGGGVKDRRPLKAVMPGGPSNTILCADEIDVAMDFDSLRQAGSGLGTAGVIVYDDQDCMLRVAMEYTNFFAEESCGQCPPCKMGTANLTMTLEKIEAGKGGDKEFELLGQVCGFIKGRGYCTLVNGAVAIVQSILRGFDAEIREHTLRGGCYFEKSKKKVAYLQNPVL